MKATSIFFKTIIGIVFASAILSSCNSPAKKVESDKQGGTKAEVIDTMKMQFNTVNVDSMYLMFPDNNTKHIISDTDKEELGKYLAFSENDTLWNNSGIMVKMVAPDYTVISHYKDKPQDDNKWLMIWKKNGRTKYENKWYFLDEEKKNEIYRILDNYANQ